MAKMYALVDPNWGEPKIVPETIRETENEAWFLSILPQCDVAKLYSGASDYPLPKGTMGSRKNLEKSGFFVQEISVSLAGPHPQEE